MFKLKISTQFNQTGKFTFMAPSVGELYKNGVRKFAMTLLALGFSFSSQNNGICFNSSICGACTPYCIFSSSKYFYLHNPHRKLC